MMGQMVYYAVCVAMDLADKPFVALDDSERMEPSMMPRSRLAATFTRTNSTSSCSVQHAICHRAARVELRGPKDDPTVGALINVAKDASIYKFVFLAYTGFTEPKVWKGCRYFILQVSLTLAPGPSTRVTSYASTTTRPKPMSRPSTKPRPGSGHRPRTIFVPSVPILIKTENPYKITAGYGWVPLWTTEQGCWDALIGNQSQIIILKPS
ncbi:hypothetical protein EV401DRAFT_975880 [Pisolithus croceorrhizus]|nr:hypothetical protein EV401DRAFT_975880 [Pisolithus croceorrhizus]